MCRLLYVRSEDEFDITPYLEDFARISQDSDEYQGHGWGCSCLEGGEWRHYHDINPVWEDDLGQFGTTNLLIAHARSAFEDRGIRVENNMPFHDDKYVFIFNGELRGVRIEEEGRIGAEKVFNFTKRQEGTMLERVEQSVKLIRQRTREVKGLNFIIADKADAYLATVFNERPDYFQMHRCEDESTVMVCSDPLGQGWEAIPNGTVEEIC